MSGYWAEAHCEMQEEADIIWRSRRPYATPNKALRAAERWLLVSRVPNLRFYRPVARWDGSSVPPPIWGDGQSESACLPGHVIHERP